ncbi:MAG: hypothetical protein C0397_16040 [Odoribacter sp.]|nr:hypothetical protein [Odoribacter sp.]
MTNIRETTKRKQAESALRNSETHLRTLVQTIPDLIWLKDTEGVYLSCNAMFERFFGAMEADIIEKTDYDFVDRELADFFRGHDRKAMEAGKPTSNEEWVTFADDGHRVFLDTIKTPMYDSDGTLIGVLGIGRDITIRKQAEESIKKQKDDFETIFNLVPAQIWYKDTHNNFIRVNQQVCKDIGMTNDQIEGRSAEELFPSFAQQYFKDDLEVFYTRKPKLGIIEQTNTSTGEIRWVHTDKLPIFGNDGEVNGLIVFVQDITERRRAEDEITMLAHSLKSINECVSLTDLENKILFVNESFLKTYGYEENELLGENISKVNSQTNVQEQIDEILSATILGEWKGELLNRRKDGNEFPIYLSTTIIKDKDGQPLGLIGVATDITQRKHAEETLLKLSSAVEQTVDSIIITDRDGTIEYVNHAFEVLTGYSAKETLGKTPSMLKSGTKEQHFYKGLWKTILSGQVFRAEFVNKKKNGDLYDEQKTIAPIFDKNKTITHFIATGIDISERKKLELAKELDLHIQETLNKILSISVENISLEESLERILITIISIPFLSLEKKGGILLTEEGQNILTLKTSYNLSKKMQTSCAQVSFGHYLCGRAAATRQIQFVDCVDEGHEISYEGIKPHGHYNVPILTSDNVLGVIVIYLAEYHKHEKYEQDFLLAVAVILSGLIQRKRSEKELIKSKEKAEESDRLKSTFLANMSHEVRTPLNSIIGFSELLADPYFEEDQKNEFIQSIITSGNNLLSIISDIMDISKMESGEITIRKSQINAQKFISTIKEQFATQAEVKDIELKLIHPANVGEKVIFTDIERLRQIFNNLMSNAIKFTAHGSIKIGFQPKGEMVEFYVKDTGIGIPVGYHDKIFESFRQVEAGNSRKYGGNGPGLAISKNLVELMGGKIWLESESGKGSTFYFTLPAYSGV